MHSHRGTPFWLSKSLRRRQGNRLAIHSVSLRYYQSLLDSGKFESRAALARHLGVSRARVTQVLNRLKAMSDSPTPDVKAG